MSDSHGEWKYKVKAGYENGRLVQYTIAFYRKHEIGWYDEIRHDSHESTKGRKILAPHFHVKLQCAFRNSADQGVEEIKSIIDNYLDVLREMIR